MKAIQITEFGGPEVMNLVDLPEPDPGPGEALVRISRSGVNYADTHATRDDYLAKQELPLVPGAEFAGIAPDGRRVAAVVANGAYAEAIAAPEASLVPIPDEVDDEQAAGLLLQGLTADGILRISADLQPGETVVINAAAGGTGSLAVQIARSMGAGRIIALASSEEKRDLTLTLGADVAVDSRSADLRQEILDANNGRQVDVVLEMAGGQAFGDCLRALAPFGRLVTFGIASREENTVKTGHLMRNSRAVIGFWMVHLLMRPELARQGIERVLGAAAGGELKTVLGGTYALDEAPSVHEKLAARQTIGKILLDPSL
ncbi:MAG: NADPH:quinone oxidoreductase family protein [Thermoleophilia bacterium]|nr:NADPH:quinone oxidoreductase family protein [Thermoleophilia bacterium]